jgi:hypothetical protein
MVLVATKLNDWRYYCKAQTFIGEHVSFSTRKVGEVSRNPYWGESFKWYSSIFQSHPTSIPPLEKNFHVFLEFTVYYLGVEGIPSCLGSMSFTSGIESMKISPVESWFNIFLSTNDTNMKISTGEVLIRVEAELSEVH